jgi:hypothetical protein
VSLSCRHAQDPQSSDAMEHLAYLCTMSCKHMFMLHMLDVNVSSAAHRAAEPWPGTAIECLPRGIGAQVDVCCIGLGHMADRLLGARIDCWEGPATPRPSPLPVDEELRKIKKVKNTKHR